MRDLSVIIISLRECQLGPASQLRCVRDDNVVRQKILQTQGERALRLRAPPISRTLFGGKRHRKSPAV